MNVRPGVLAAVLLIGTACNLPSFDKSAPERTDAPGSLDTSLSNFDDSPILSVSAEPAWHDLIQHTEMSDPDRADFPGPSDDGRSFVYSTTEFGTHPQIALRKTEGAAPTRITNNGADNLFPRLSPDGKRVAWSCNKDGNWDLYVCRINAPAAISQLTFESSEDISPSWDPTGRKLVYSSRKGKGPWRLVIINVSTRLKTYLGPGLYPDWGGGLDPLICFQSQPRKAGGRTSIWVVRPDGSELREAVSDKNRGWSAIHPHFSRDGKWIAYATIGRSRESRAFGKSEEADDIWIIRPDGTDDTRLTEDLSGESWPAWGGDRVFFVSTRGEGRNIYSVSPKPLEEEE